MIRSGETYAIGANMRPASSRESLDSLQAKLIRLHGDSDLPSEADLTEHMRPKTRKLARRLMRVAFDTTVLWGAFYRPAGPNFALLALAAQRTPVVYCGTGALPAPMAVKSRSQASSRLCHVSSDDGLECAGIPAKAKSPLMDSRRSRARLTRR